MKRPDTAGRDVTDLPGLWSEEDTVVPDHHEMDWDELDLEYARKRGKAAEAKVKELETHLDWNRMRHVGEPDDPAEDIAYLRNMLRLARERIKDLEAEALKGGE